MTMSYECPICERSLERDFDRRFASNYPRLVCRQCDERAVSHEGSQPEHYSWVDSGDNPVFIDEHQCWRRYRFGGFVTMLDPWKCESMREFNDRQRAEKSKRKFN